MASRNINQKKLKEASDRLRLKFPEINTILPFKLPSSASKTKERHKCSFQASNGLSTIDVYPDMIEVESIPGYSYNPIRLSLKDLKRIKECILYGDSNE